MEIKQSSATLALVFFMVDDADHVTGKTGLTPTVTLSKNGGAFASPAGAVSEIGNGFYKVAPNATDTDTLGLLALTATATGADRCAMAFEIVANIEADSVAALGALNDIDTAAIRTELATELARLDVPISTRNATAPDNAGIAAIKAKTDDAENILLASPYVPTEAPVLVIPAPDGDNSLTVVYVYTANIIGQARAGIALQFKLASTPSAAARILETASAVATTDANGYAQISLQSGKTYKVTSRDLDLDRTFTPSGETFDLLTLLA